MPDVRPSNRSDRGQLSQLANVHIAAVMPGVAYSRGRGRQVSAEAIKQPLCASVFDAMRQGQ